MKKNECTLIVTIHDRLVLIVDSVSAKGLDQAFP